MPALIGAVWFASYAKAGKTRLLLQAGLHFHRQAYNRRMISRNLKSLDSAQMMPTPEVPDSYGPRNEADVHVYNLVKDALDAGPGKKYATVADFMRTLDARVSR
jgi:hypothetical protein